LNKNKPDDRLEKKSVNTEEETHGLTTKKGGHAIKLWNLPDGDVINISCMCDTVCTYDTVCSTANYNTCKCNLVDNCTCNKVCTCDCACHCDLECSCNEYCSCDMHLTIGIPSNLISFIQFK
jgi:hypothetical protein